MDDDSSREERIVTTVFAENPAKRHDIVCGAGLLDEVPARLTALLPSRGKTVVITDSNVRALHGDTLLTAFAREGSCVPLVKVRSSSCPCFFLKAL